MINISKFLNSRLIIADLPAVGKEEVIKLLVDKLIVESKGLNKIDRDNIYKDVINRENMQTTGLGKGLAFPHARIEGWEGFSVALAISREGVDFKSVDGIPVKFVFLMVSSPDEPYIILQTMAAIIRFLNDKVQQEMLIKDMTAQEIVERFTLSNVSAHEQILACDVARPVRSSVNLKTAIEDVARTMHLKRFDVLPVVDDNN